MEQRQMTDFILSTNQIFRQSVEDYHLTDNVDQPCNNPYPAGTIEHDLYQKNWIDAVQWHLEDLIRDPDIDPQEALLLKRRIDKSNQDRTDLVEQIGSYFWTQFHSIQPQPGATINTESPAWAIDRLSILHLKIYHMQEQVNRTDASREHIQKCKEKLHVLQQQYTDLSEAISCLLQDYASGQRIMRVYKQMKMYNDASTNPVLYRK